MKSCLALALCVAVAGVLSAQVRTKPSPPNVFLITIDTLRADHVHCYGYEKIQTPALDALAADGVRFTQAFTPSPITNTSHTTILTGLLPSSHGVTDFAIPLASSHATWAELLKGNGYHTAAFIGAVILDAKSLAPGLDRGFDFYDNFPEHSESKSRWGRVERRGMDVVQRAENWLTAHPAGPRFAWVHLYDPHDPYEPPPPYSEIYKDRLFDGEIAYADSVLGNFIQYLKRHGWYDNSTIIVVGDHGEGLGEHHEETHGIFLYDSTTHVPLIIKLPRQKNAGKVIEAQVRTLDILPTALDLTGVAAPGTLDGKSLTPYFSGDTSDRVAIGETDYPLRFGWTPLRSVRTDGLKFIQAPRPELYDLHTDPRELENKYRPEDDAVGKLKSLLPAQESANKAQSLPDPKDKIEEQNLLHQAMIASDDNRTSDARTALEKVIELDPKSPTALRQLGELEFQTGEYAKAAGHLKRAREVRPDDATAAFLQGEALQKTGDLAGASDALEQSLKLVPGQFEARLLLSQTYLKLNDAKAAEDQAEAALLLQPESVDAVIAVARAQIADHRFAEAVETLKPFSERKSVSAELFEVLSQAYAGTGKETDAQRAKGQAERLRKPAPQNLAPPVTPRPE
jgi:arylsulfatase A-like enzyme/cytochrome c-type biogenesis protein CcmH/NrfG